MADHNNEIINEFRTNDGKVGGYFAGAKLVLMTTIGAKSGETRTSPVMSFQRDGTVYVIASKAGADTNPAWYHNMKKNPAVGVELATDHGIEAFDATAVEVPRAQRDKLYAEFSADNPGFAEYEKKTTRIIPIIELRKN
jgi:deazaflavin-dependent oxidoreductase (nitroreductase family)